jgi:hypothetical protein
MLQLSQGGVVAVTVTLIDDTINVVNATGWGTRVDPADNLAHVWPGAGTGVLKGSRHVAVIALGEHWAKFHVDKPALGWPYWESVILHESLHSQCTGPATKWGNVNITYGLDEAHPITEFLGAQDKAFEEGLGSFYGLAHSTSTMPRSPLRGRICGRRQRRRRPSRFQSRSATRSLVERATRATS